jgi:ribosomal-protein-alanine N-acetyltransferase
VTDAVVGGFFPLECRICSPEWRDPLAKFFSLLRQAGDDRHFHPHPLDDEEAENRASYAGKDLYYILVEGRSVLGYGMLRGWDEGYEIPSLGIAVHPSARGMGIGRALMGFLHASARLRGARQVRLKVHRDNISAMTLYKDLGYVFQPEEAGQFVGFVAL